MRRGDHDPFARTSRSQTRTGNRVFYLMADSNGKSSVFMIDLSKIL
jgi:hypothetical protein